jgi:hypothetical protein
MLRYLQTGSCLWIAFAVLGTVPLAAQGGAPRGPELLMHPQYDRGQPVSPIFEGWYRNADQTYTLVFGFYNRNAVEHLEVPLGPENFIEPAIYDGIQPTSFPTGRPAFSIGRGWGVFGVVVPADFSPSDQVTWTLQSKGRTHSVPGRISSPEYQLTEVDQPVGNGSMPPRVRFEQRGAEGIGFTGVTSSRTLRTRVGVPVALEVWAADNFQEGRRQPVPINLTWHKYAGPSGGEVTFASRSLTARAEGSQASTMATFSVPGDYVLRVEAGNFGARDSTNENHCCWTNGYVKVTVVP